MWHEGRRKSARFSCTNLRNKTISRGSLPIFGLVLIIWAMDYSPCLQVCIKEAFHFEATLHIFSFLKIWSAILSPVLFCFASWVTHNNQTERKTFINIKFTFNQIHGKGCHSQEMSWIHRAIFRLSKKVIDGGKNLDTTVRHNSKSSPNIVYWWVKHPHEEFRKVVDRSCTSTRKLQF